MTKPSQNILVLRFSAMGDVVLTTPVIQSFLDEYPDTNIVVVSKPFHAPFFENMPGVTFFGADLKGKHKGLSGLFRLAKTLKKEYNIDLLLDLHSVIRTWILGVYFRLMGVKVWRIDKGRKAKKEFVKIKSSIPLKHTIERYKEVFEKAGFTWQLSKKTVPVTTVKRQKKDKKIIGIAPFAAHKSKQWGTTKIYELIEKMQEKHEVEIILFGGGKNEVEQLEEIASYYNSVTSIAGKYTLTEEMQYMKTLDAFVSMDSGNMHIASLLGIPVISVWGGTHPDLGFRALYQPKENSIQLPEGVLDCRPCSVFGTSQCVNVARPFACMESLGVDKVVDRLESILGFDIVENN